MPTISSSGERRKEVTGKRWSNDIQYFALAFFINCLIWEIYMYIM